MSEIEFNNFTISEDIYGPVLAIAVAIEMILALTTNLFILLFTLRHPKSLKQPSIIFLTSLILANLLASVFFMPFTVITAATGEWIFGVTQEEKEAVCLFVGFMFAFSIGLSIHILALISFDRFLFIVKPLLYRRFMKTWVAVIILVLVWIIAGVVDTTPFFGLGIYGFSISTASCVPIWVGQTVYVIYFSVYSFVLFNIIILTSLWTFCFTRYFIKNQRNNNRMMDNNTQKHVYTRRLRNLISIFGMLLLANILSFSPYAVVSFIGYGVGFEAIPSPVYATVLVFLLLNNTASAIIQSYFRRDLKEAIISGLKKMKKCLCRLHKQVTPSQDYTPTTVNDVLSGDKETTESDHVRESLNTVI